LDHGQEAIKEVQEQKVRRKEDWTRQKFQDTRESRAGRPASPQRVKATEVITSILGGLHWKLVDAILKEEKRAGVSNMGSSGQTEASTATSSPGAETGAATAPSANEGFARLQVRQDSPGGPTSSTGQEGLSERDSLRISLVRNAHYHEDRERFFARTHRVAMFVVVASGTASFAFAKSTPIFAGIITLTGLIDLVFDVSGKARLHASLRRRIYDVLAQAEDESRSVAQLREQAVRIYADEPPCMHAVNALAYNAAMLAFNRPHKYLLKIDPYYRILRHWLSFASVKFKTYEELQAESTTIPDASTRPAI
jgi:hypothetical protein